MKLRIIDTKKLDDTISLFEQTNPEKAAICKYVRDVYTRELDWDSIEKEICERFIFTKSEIDSTEESEWMKEYNNHTITLLKFIKEKLYGTK